MLRRSTRSDASRDESGRLRSGRGLGPFTGAQLTVIILGITLAIAFPIGAWAVTGSNIFVTDSTSGKTAKVSATGQLITKANVSGSVTATQTPPGSSYTNYTQFYQDQGCVAITPPIPSGKALVVTSVTVAVLDGANGATLADLYGGNDCVSTLPFDSAFLGGNQWHTVIPLTTGVPINASHKVMIYLGGGLSADAHARTIVHGYLVPSTMCTTTGPPVGCF